MGGTFRGSAYLYETLLPPASRLSGWIDKTRYPFYPFAFGAVGLLFAVAVYLIPNPYRTIAQILAAFLGTAAIIIGLVLLFLDKARPWLTARAFQRFRSLLKKTARERAFLEALYDNPSRALGFWEGCKEWEFLSRLGDDVPLTWRVLDEFTQEYELFCRRQQPPPWADKKRPSKELKNDAISAAMHELQRATSFWLETKFPSGPRPQYVKGASHPGAEWYLEMALRYPFLYRLNFMRQIGTLGFGLNLDAAHCRLSHVCGTVEGAALYLDSLQKDLPAGLKGVEIPSEQREAVLVGALIHDAFQGPYGHSLEMLRSVLLHDNNSARCRLDHAFVWHALQDLNPRCATLTPRGNVLKQIVESVRDKNSDPDKIVRFIKFLFHPQRRLPSQEASSSPGTGMVGESGNEESGKWYFLTEILDSPTLDADRFDYVARDALHLGRPIFDKHEWSDVLMRARVLESKEEKAGITSTVRRISFARYDRDRISKFLNLRRSLYHSVYESPRKLAWDDMLCHSIFYHFEAAGIVEQATLIEWQKRAAERKLHAKNETERNARLDLEGKRRDLFDLFLLLTDEALFPFLRSLREHVKDRLKAKMLRNMVLDLRTNRPFVPVCEYQITGEQWLAFCNPSSDSRGAVQDQPSSNLAETSDQPKCTKGPGINLQDVPLVPAPGGLTPDDKVLLKLALFLANSFSTRVIFEREVWQELLQNKEIKDCWFDMLKGRYTDDSAENAYELSFKFFPGLHLTIPRFSTQPGEFPSQQDKGQHYDPDSGEPKVFWYHENKEPSWKPVPGVIPRRRYRLIASVPFGLHEIKNIGGREGMIHKCLMNTLPLHLPFLRANSDHKTE